MRVKEWDSIQGCFLMFPSILVTLLMSEYRQQVRALPGNSVWQGYFPLEPQLSPGAKWQKERYDLSRLEDFTADNPWRDIVLYCSSDVYFQICKEVFMSVFVNKSALSFSLYYFSLKTVILVFEFSDKHKLLHSFSTPSFRSIDWHVAKALCSQITIWISWKPEHTFQQAVEFHWVGTGRDHFSKS